MSDILFGDMEQNEDISNKFLTFQVASQVFGIPIDQVIEIVQMQPITAMPELPHHAKGMINLRGRVIPVFDVNLRFGNPEEEYGARTCIVILNVDGVQAGCIVDAVEEVVDISPDRIAPPPTLGSGAADYVTSIGKLDSGMVLLLDCRRLLSDDLSVFGLA